MTNRFGKALSRTAHRWIIATLLLGPAAVVLMAAPEPVMTVTQAPTSERCMPGPDNGWCAPTDHPRVSAEVARQAALGLTCASEPVLTDVIIWQSNVDLAVTVVTFDEALELAEAGSGWVQRFCS